MKSRVAIACGSAAALVLLLPRLGYADVHAPMHLTWDAPAQCPQQAAVEERMAELTASLAGKLKPSRLRAEGRIESIGERYRLTLVIHDGSAVGTRVIESDSCEDLGGAAAVTLGLLVRVEQTSNARLSDSTLGGVAEQPPRKPASTKPRPRPESPAQPIVDQGHEPTSRSQWDWLLRVPRIGIDVGVFPRPSYGAGLALGLGHQGWRVLLGGTLWLPQSIPVPGFPGFSVETNRASLDLEGRRSWQVGRFEVGPCLIANLDGVVARGSGPGVVSRSRQVVWLSLGLGLGGAWRLQEHTSVTLNVGGRFSTSRPHLVIHSLPEVHRVRPAAVGARVAYQWIF
ncbi:MAG: hypothetical protein JW940_39150 [Polyangiaceae bacterium]|nr:hypothetical protein [Polyangiaceae bacterium]